MTFAPLRVDRDYGIGHRCGERVRRDFLSVTMLPHHSHLNIIRLGYTRKKGMYMAYTRRERYAKRSTIAKGPNYTRLTPKIVYLCRMRL